MPLIIFSQRDEHFSAFGHLINKRVKWEDDMRKTLRAFTVFCLMALLLTPVPALTELMIAGGRVAGDFITRDGVLVLVDMPEPAAFPQPLTQSRLVKAPINDKDARRALDQFALETGVLNPRDTNITGQSLYYMQGDYRHHGASIVEFDDYAAPAGEDAQHLRAQAAVKGFLDALGISGYEYPFYACRYDYLLWGSAFHPFASQEDWIRSESFNVPESLPQYGIWDYRVHLDKSVRGNLEKYDILGRPPTEVAVRFLLDDVPLHTTNSWSPGQSGITGDGNAVPFARFVVTKEGVICFAYIQFWFQEQKAQPDPRPILPWQDILTQALTIPWEEYHQKQTSGDRQLWLRAVEPMKSVDENGLTFPIWRIMLEEEDLAARRDFPGHPDSFYYEDFSFTFDAFTGAAR